MGISPRALSHYLAKYPFIDQNKAHGAQLPSVAEGLRKRRLDRADSIEPSQPVSTIGRPMCSCVAGCAADQDAASAR